MPETALLMPQPDRIRAAAEELERCRRALAKCGSNVVAELLRPCDAFYEDDHYPEGDVIDRDAGSQYYYHAHRGIEQEHGHFHTFARLDETDDCGDDGNFVHLVAISMDPWGEPTGLFTTNRWVTGGQWLDAHALEPLLGQFEVEHAWPSWPTNRWLTALLQLYHNEIMLLLKQRDTALLTVKASAPEGNCLENRAHEVLSFMPIELEAKLAEALRAGW